MGYLDNENKYLNNAHISEVKFRKVLKYFASDFDAPNVLS